jgi:hypothetical protein
VDDTSPLLIAVDRLADRLRTLPQSRLRRRAAAEALALARDLAMRAQWIEAPGGEPRIMPDAGLFAVGDQVAVAGHDLAHALERAPRAREADAALADALDLIRATARRCGV